MGRLLYRVGSLAARRHWLFLTAWVAVAATVVFLVLTYGSNTSDNLSLPGTDSQAATDLLASRFPPQQNGSSPVMFAVETGKVTDAANKQAIEESHAAIVQLPNVFSATDPFSQQGQAQISEDGTIAFIPVLLDVGGDALTEEIAASVLDAAEPAREAGMAVAVGGPVGSELSEPTTEGSDLIGLIAAMLILTFAFGTIVAAGMPIVSAVVGLVVGLSCIGLLGHIATVPSIAPTLATMIGLGVGIDYALFLVSRHRSHLREGMEVRKSIALTVATSGSAILYAAGTVVIALLALAVAGIPLVTSLGYAAAVAVVTAALAAITLLPALLSLVGGGIDVLSLPTFMRPRPKEPGKGIWAGWARLVARRPWLVLLGVLAVVVPLVIPLFSLQLGQEDIGATPKSTTERQAYDLMTNGFGIGYNGPLLIAVELGTPATPSSEYESQLSQAMELQQELEQEQAQGTAQQNALTQEADALEEQQSELEQQQAELEKQQADLEQQSDELTAEQGELSAEARELEQEAARLLVEQRLVGKRQEELALEALALAGRAGSLLRALARNNAEIDVVEARIARTRNAARKETLEAELQVLTANQQRLESQLVELRGQEEGLRADEQTLRDREASLRGEQRAVAQKSVTLAREAADLAAESAALLQQKQDLEQDASALQVQAANLQTNAAELQTQQAQLEALQQQAATQQQQAEQLQSELTQELTMAGGDARGTDLRLVTLQNDLSATPGVDVVSPPQINQEGNAVTYNVIAATAPASPVTADLVLTLRTFTIPQATDGTDAVAHVGGVTAANVDLADEISSRLLLVIVTVIALSFAVLMTAYRSLIVPLQAALANVLAVAAAFGVLTALFQWGWGIDLLGIDTASDSVPIASYVPLMMFAVLFGLSMDYQVFLLSQIEHGRAKGLDARHAVESALATAAPVILSAALIMIAVFGSFILNGDPTVKQFGVGLAAGVALAATMVLTLAPAILVVTDRAIWWLPGRLGRFLPRLDIEGAALESNVAASADESSAT